MKLNIKLLSCILTISLLGLWACEDNTTTIGSVIASGEVEITFDSITYDLHARPIKIDEFDSKSGNLMIGKLQNANYGSLDCSFVTRLMSASSLGVPDSLFSPERVDSCKLMLGAKRGNVVGDSLAPQILTVYKLNKQLPSDITNAFNPEGYYDPSQPFASRSYTLSEIASSDSLLYNASFVDISVNLPVEFGREIFQSYKDDPSIFQWPQSMAEKFLPGLCVKSTFGNGCVANIQSLYVGVYYHSLQPGKDIIDGDTISVIKHVGYVTIPFTVSPEVLSSNNITYIPSENIINKNSSGDGQVVLTTPGGYLAEFEFPIKDLINRYQEKDMHLSTVNDLNLYIPAQPFDENSGIGVPDNILMIKTSEYESFFAQNKVPDSKIAFTGVYDPTKKQYYFSSLRNYITEMLEKDEITEEDTNFTLVPVEIITETVNNYYGSGTTYVTKCFPYTSRPTMTLLKTNESTITFSFSTQIIN